MNGTHLESLGVRDTLVLDDGPELSLLVTDKKSSDGDGSDELGADQLALIVLGLRGPAEESGHILGHLGLSGRGVILPLDTTIVEGLAHRDGITGEVDVVVQTLTKGQTGRGLLVTHQQGVDVVLTTGAAKDNQAEIRGDGTAVGKGGSLLVGVRRRKAIKQLTRALEHLTLLIGAISDLDGASNSLGLLLSVRHTDQLTVRTVLQRVASGANLTVNLETTTNTCVIEGVEESVVRPGVLGEKAGVRSKDDTAGGHSRHSGTEGSALGDRGETAEHDLVFSLD